MQQSTSLAALSSRLKQLAQAPAPAAGVRTLQPQEWRQVAGGGVCNPFTGVCSSKR